mgnify:CR=1 FL=1|jgi:signal peptidase II
MNLVKEINEKKNLFLKKENITSLIIIILFFLLDRYSKIEIINNLNNSTFFINSFINFDLIWNTGVGFGLLSFSSSLMYNAMSVIIGLVILILTYILFTSEKLDKIIISVIVGGALGNFYDRLTYNAVPDFIDLHYGNFHWFTFNVADIFITLGILTFLLKEFLIKK